MSVQNRCFLASTRLGRAPARQPGRRACGERDEKAEKSMRLLAVINRADSGNNSAAMRQAAAPGPQRIRFQKGSGMDAGICGRQAGGQADVPPKAARHAGAQGGGGRAGSFAVRHAGGRRRPGAPGRRLFARGACADGGGFLFLLPGGGFGGGGHAGPRARAADDAPLGGVPLHAGRL